jgi:hypothetical protein
MYSSVIFWATVVGLAVVRILVLILCCLLGFDIKVAYVEYCIWVSGDTTEGLKQ